MPCPYPTRFRSIGSLCGAVGLEAGREGLDGRDPFGHGSFSCVVERAADGQGTAIEDVGVNHRGLYVLMTKQLLYVL